MNMNDSSLDKVKVVWLQSPALNGYPSDEIKWAIRRAIVKHDLVQRARFVKVVADWHRGGRPQDLSPDQRLHCTFDAQDADRAHISTLHGFPESEVPAGVANIVESWRTPNGLAPRSQAINEAYRGTGGRPGTSYRNQMSARGGPSIRDASNRDQIGARRGPDANNRGQMSARRGPSIHDASNRDQIGARRGPDANNRDQMSARRGPGIRDASNRDQIGARRGPITRDQPSNRDLMGSWRGPSNNLQSSNRNQVSNLLTPGSAYQPRDQYPNSARPYIDSRPQGSGPAGRLMGNLAGTRLRNIGNNIATVLEDPGLEEITRGINRLTAGSRGTDDGLGRHVNANPYEARTREPLANKSTNTKMASSQVESGGPQQQEKKSQVPDDGEQNKKGEFGSI
ncbi:hypothetical protein Vi05172_g9553 [Venturia inaequalis]|nr:hypothetical protein Vi05172_g9553 [Venturia inaequalis]